MVYRRRIRGHRGSPEIIEIVPKADPPDTFTEADLPHGDSIQVVFDKIENETHIYHVEIPSYLEVKPPDWRDLAYDHDEVKRLMGLCIEDNSRCLAFEPLTEKTVRRVEKELTVALRDLSSIMDLLLVKCTARKEHLGELEVEVQFEHKNGEQKIMFMQVGPFA